MQLKNVVVSKLRDTARVLNHRDLMRLKIEADRNGTTVGKIGVLEFHPSDACDLSCAFCTYRSTMASTETKAFPYEHLGRIVTLEPKAIILVGGGEPTQYKSDGKNIHDLVTFLRSNLPKTKLGLATNGAQIPPGDWLDYLAWVRVSLDTHDPVKFRQLKDGNLDDRINVLSRYVESNIPHVGFGYLYNRFNIDEMLEFIEFIYRTISQASGRDPLKKVNVQFRPTCLVESCECPSAFHKKGGLLTPDLHASWIEQFDREIDRLRKSPLAEFILQNTNLSELRQLRGVVPLPRFSKCFVSLARWILRPNGDIYPCVIKASNDRGGFGNLIAQEISEIERAAYDIYNLRPGHCNGASECCKYVGQTNEFVEANLTSQVIAKTTDTFF